MANNDSQSWRCEVCGYIHFGARPPDGCPICGATAEDFTPHEEPVADRGTTSASRWRCLNCNYLHNGSPPPDECPVCGAQKNRFEPLTETDADNGTGDFKGHLVVVGGGIAGVSAIEAFRKVNSGGAVTLIAREKVLPYYRLNLTRLLAGEVERDALPIHHAAWYDKMNVDLKDGEEVVSVDADAARVTLRSGAEMPFDRLLMTVGAHPFIPPLEGVRREGVFALRTIDDAQAILSTLKPGIRCVVVGGGLLGLEAAGGMAARDADVTLLEGHDWLMPRQLNRQAGRRLAEHVRKLGIKIVRNARSRALLGDERVTGVKLEDETVVAADLVLVATGIRPNSHLARRMGVEVNKGIVVDNYLRTSHPNLLAAGDVAEHRGVLYGNWAASQFQGGIAGMNAAGASVEFGGIPRSNTLKVLGLDLLSIGQFSPEDGSYLVVEDELDGAYYRFVFRDEHLVGAVLVGDTAFSGAVKQAVEKQIDLSAPLHRRLDAKQWREEFHQRGGQE